MSSDTGWWKGAEPSATGQVNKRYQGRLVSRDLRNAVASGAIALVVSALVAGGIQWALSRFASIPEGATHVVGALLWIVVFGVGCYFAVSSYLCNYVGADEAGIVLREERRRPARQIPWSEITAIEWETHRISARGGRPWMTNCYARLRDGSVVVLLSRATSGSEGPPVVYELKSRLEANRSSE